MKKCCTNHNLVLLFAISLTLWAVYSFFSWQIKPLPQKIPDELINNIMQEGYFGEPAFLSSQMMDAFVLNHPDLNIFPAGGEALKNAQSLKNFYIIESFQSLDCKDIDKNLDERFIVSSNGYTLKKCKSSKAGDQTINASSFLEKFTVTVAPSTEPVRFQRGVFKTGRNGWQKIEIGSAEFNKKNIIALSAHPLPDQKEIKIEIPPVDKKSKKIIVGYGIADSGKVKGSKPVEMKISQLSNEVKFLSVDGKWNEKEIKGFSSFEPLTVTISVTNSGKRHFYFDISYILEEQ